MGDKKSFLLYYSQKDIFDSLPDEQAGQLIKAIFHYECACEMPKLDGLMSAVFVQFRQVLDMNKEKHKTKCDKNKRNGSLGGRPQKTEGNPNKPNGFSENPKEPNITQRNPKKPDMDMDMDMDIEKIKDKTLLRSEADAQSSESLAVQTAAGAGESKPASPSKTLIDQRFNDFWQAYPKKRNKENAKRAWKKIAPSESLHKTILAAIEAAKQSKDWQKDQGQFIPYPATWLNAGAWEDERGDEADAEGTPGDYYDRFNNFI